MYDQFTSDKLKDLVDPLPFAQPLAGLWSLDFYGVRPWNLTDSNY